MRSCNKNVLVFSIALLLQSPVIAKGPLDEQAAAYYEKIVIPILIKEAYCADKIDCRNKEVFFCVTWEKISCDFYSIKDKKIIINIVAKTISNDIHIYSVNFWSKTHKEKKFLDKPIFSYINQIGERQ